MYDAINFQFQSVELSCFELLPVYLYVFWAGIVFFKKQAGKVLSFVHELNTTLNVCWMDVDNEQH